MTRAVPHIGTYRRKLPVSLERMYENTIDWEHLPYLHRSSFARIECLQADHTGFRAWVWTRRAAEGPPFLLELTLDRDLRRWISRTIEGPGAGSEIWTQVVPLGERRIEVIVDFFIPAIPADRRDATREFYTNLYTRLYDEDEAMMTLRQQRLDDLRGKRLGTGAEIQRLGPLDSVRRRLPLIVEGPDGSRFKIVEIADRLVALPAVCPHWLGPLDQGEVVDGVVTCPWHGYRFEIATRRCVTAARYHLQAAPMITLDSGEVALKWRLDGSRDRIN